jgi:hypothetical protein
MLREANSYYDGAAEAAGAGFYEKQLPLWDRCEAQQEALVEEIARQGGMNPGFMWMITRARNAEDIDRISRMLAQRIVVITMPSLARLSQLTESTNVHSILSQIAFALAAYKDAYGEYPAALDALTPKYFDKLPVDRFTEKALHYRRLDDGGFTLYSVGADMEDDGGVEGVEDCDVVVTTAEQE